MVGVADAGRGERRVREHALDPPALDQQAAGEPEITRHAPRLIRDHADQARVVPGARPAGNPPHRDPAVRPGADRPAFRQAAREDRPDPVVRVAQRPRDRQQLLRLGIARHVERVSCQRDARRQRPVHADVGRCLPIRGGDGSQHQRCQQWRSSERESANRPSHPADLVTDATRDCGDRLDCRSRPHECGRIGVVVEYDYDLGFHSWPVTTGSREAQTWFDRGLVWSYGVQPRGGDRVLRAGGRARPRLRDGALGDRLRDRAELQQAVGGVRRAGAGRRSSASRMPRVGRAAATARAAAAPVEQALDRGARRERYPSRRPPDDRARGTTPTPTAMRDVYRRHPRRARRRGALRRGADEPHAVAAVGSVHRPAGRGRGHGSRPSRCSSARSRGPGGRHPGLLHLYVHLMEMSPLPRAGAAGGGRAARPRARRRPPARTCRRTSTCSAATTATWSTRTTRAIEADEKYLAREGPLNFYTLYRCHDHHFTIYGAMFLGRLELALEAADELAASLPRGAAAGRAAADGRLARGVRPDAPARAGPLRAVAGDHRAAAARRPRALLHHDGDDALRARASPTRRPATWRAAERSASAVRAPPYARVPDSRYLFNNTCQDILAVAGAMLDGELEYRRGNFDAAFEHLRRAIALDDALPYDEPWGWMQPTRHAYGALLLEQGRVEEAEAVYRADLGLDDTLRAAVPAPRETSGACTATTSACTASAGATSADGVGRSSTWRSPAPTSRSRPPASAASADTVVCSCRRDRAEVLTPLRREVDQDVEDH